MFVKGVWSPLTILYTYRSSKLSILLGGKEYHQETIQNFMSNDDFSHTIVVDGLKIMVACHPSDDDQKILSVAVNGKSLDSYQYLDKNFGKLLYNSIYRPFN